jgi:Zn-dependent protease with chaperone function
MNLRARTDIRFGILVAAVLATGFFAFSAVGSASPQVNRISTTMVRPCMDSLDARVAGITDDTLQLRARLALAGECWRPYFRAQVRWVAGGLLATAVLTVALYLLHPWWLRRHRRMRRLGDPEVTAELDRLAAEAGLDRSPDWLLAPYAAGHGGQAFGLPWRYRVCLDVGLLVRYDGDRAAFRAVARHELAHLTNRDVGRTYLTVALWWSFVAVAVSPFVAVTLNLDVLRDPLGTPSGARAAYRIIALLVLTLTGYLLRNAILRARELCADSTAARVPEAAPALSRVLSSLPWPPRHRRRSLPPRLARLGPHPAPADRVATVAEPGRLTGTTWWELTGLGFMAGLALNNVSLLAASLLERYIAPGLLLLTLPVTLLIAGLLAGALRHPGLPPHAVLTLPAGLAVGFGVSELLNLMVAYNDVLTPLDHGPVAFALSVVVLALLTIAIATWLRSVRRHLHPHLPDRWVTATAVVVAGPLIAVWYNVTYLSNNFGGFDLTVLPETGLTIGWYREVSRWLNAPVVYVPAIRLGATPFLALGLILLWAVPLVRARLVDVRHAARIGLLMGAVALVAAVALPFLARAALPAGVRRTPAVDPPSGFTFTMEYGLAYVALAALLAALAAGLVAATTAHLRPVLVPLAFSVTVVLAALGFSVTTTVFRCLGVNDALVRSCVPEVPGSGSLTVFHFHLILVWGVAAAVPAAFAGALLRRLPGPPAFAAALLRRPPAFAGALLRRPVAARSVGWAGLGLVAVVFPAAAALAIPYNITSWKPAALPSIPAPLAGAAVDECLVGEWREVSYRLTLAVDGKPVEFTGGSATQTFRRDGTALLDFGSGVTRTATAGGHRFDIVLVGRIIASYRAQGGVATYPSARVDGAGSSTLMLDGVVRNRTLLQSDLSDEHYTCTGDRLHQSSATPGNEYDVTLVRR